ncbi:transcriptional regulator, XRE family [mine drainage metagenome]|uniref:Transcriptional regulator, XRE family n=1 Tax=mine drainage metagenome TaxID=410659 RepID=T1CYE6_9ZZZZ
MQPGVFSFAAQLKAARAITGWSQGELSDRSGVSRPTIARIEALIMQPRLDTVAKLKQTFLTAGVQILDGEPRGGFSIIVDEGTLAGLLHTHETMLTKKGD